MTIIGIIVGVLLIACMVKYLNDKPKNDNENKENTKDKGEKNNG